MNRNKKEGERIGVCSARCLLLSAVSPALCEQIAQLRRKLRRIGTHKVLFLDETALRLSEAATHTLVLPGEQPYVVATETSSYSRRYDMIAWAIAFSCLRFSRRRREVMQL